MGFRPNPHRAATLADSSDYLYAYVRSYYGGIFSNASKTIVFLFDIKNETVKYAEERIVISQKTSYSPEGDVYSPEQLLLECISDLDVSLDVIGEAYFNIKDELEEMFSWKELDLPYIYDRGCYTVFLKNGKRKRRISIQEEMYYSPYLRLLRFFHDIVELMKEGK